MAEPLRRVVVVGGDSCAPGVGAFVANSLRGTDAKITLVDSLSGYSGVASTLPLSTDFCKLLRFREPSLVAGTGATFKLGTEYSGWLQDGQRFLQSYGEHGVPIRLLPFHQYFIHHKLDGGSTHFGDYSLADAAIRNGRFSYPSPDPASWQLPYQYGLQVDTERFAGAMLQYAIAAGVEHVPTAAAGASVRADSGFIESVSLEDGTVIGGELFIDCSGERGMLIGEVLGADYQGWSGFLPCDRCVRVSIKNVFDLSPVTRIVAKAHGWSRRMQLLERADVEYFYNVEITSDADAAMQLAQDVGADRSAVQEYRSVRAGRRETPWRGNCIAIGRSAGDLEPLEVSALSRAHSAVMRLMTLWPHADCDPVIADEYNRLTSREYEFARDFATLFYVLSDRNDSDFWRHCQSLTTPETLDYRLSLFRSRGRLSWDAEDIFSRDNWFSALLGLDCLPQASDPLVDLAEPALVEQLMSQLLDAIRDKVEKMPRHDVFLRQLHEQARNRNAKQT